MSIVWGVGGLLGLGVSLMLGIRLYRKLRRPRLPGRSGPSVMTAINLRSDTQTLPTAAMLEAIATAPLGDDTYGDDPTVARFEDMAAARDGHERGDVAMSGHMANLIALIVHAPAGTEVILDADSHIMRYEVGSLASVAHVMPWPVTSEAGMLDPARVAAAIRERDIHYPTPKLLCLENTHNRSGGRVIPLRLHDEVCEVAHARGLAVHLDGARIFNAAIAAGVAGAGYTQSVDSVMFALTKGLELPARLGARRR